MSNCGGGIVYRRLMIVIAFIFVALSAPGATIEYVAQAYDADEDILTNGTLVAAYNLGNTANAITHNGVTFAVDPGAGVSPFIVDGSVNYSNSSLFGGAGIGTLSSGDAQLLLDYIEYGSGPDKTLCRLSSLTVGQTYLLQVLTSHSSTGVRFAYGYSTPSGNAAEVYSLTGVAANPAVAVTGWFTADETTQDIRIKQTDAAFAAALAAYQVRQIAYAPLTFTSDVFDAESDISTEGRLVKAYNLGTNVPVTVNGVTFAADTGTNTFFASSGGDGVNAGFYTGGGIGSVSSNDMNRLLDSIEWGSGSSTLGRLSNLIVGREYILQLLVIEQTTAGSKISFGCSVPVGHASKIYTLNGVDTYTSPKVVTCRFTAQETSADFHLKRLQGALNGQLCAFQLRNVSPRGSLFCFQ